ncbi:ycf3-interacting protein 1, chloroplastic [Diospyros lotus]|uniref:ycf3-interacting protein 1, chloroplastic n=1 Tax=Diospyros lotus TaxID=55363 RepID=UPI0022507B69|nr:ycf3-interacting protein 1, chloroplastic [Diospyros lotus]
MALQLFQPASPLSASCGGVRLQSPTCFSVPLLRRHCCFQKVSSARRGTRKMSSVGMVFVGKEETQLGLAEKNADDGDDENDDYDEDPTPDDLEYVSQVKRVLELLRKNRDMLFGEVKLTVLIEDPREVERRRLLGIDDSDAPTREDLVAALEEVNEGKIPKDRVALRMLAEEMMQWPNLEVEVPKTSRRKSLYAKATDTGVDPEVAAKRLKVDWDSAADIDEDVDGSDDADVPPALGYGALYLVTAFPVIIGISVVLILFYNSLQ